MCKKQIGAGRPHGSKTKQRFSKISAGRQVGWKKPKDEKRISLHSFRLPLWIVRWLREQDESGGKLIEKAIVNYYGIDRNE